MTNNKNRSTTRNTRASCHRLFAFAAAALLALAWVPSATAGDGKAGDGNDDYQQTNLVSDLAGVAQLQDTNLVNAWGISMSGNSPFWISANGTGLALLYSVTNDASGQPHVSKVGLQVMIPGEGTPTGQVFNNTGAFNGDAFIFASEDGTISGWRNALGTTAEVLTNRATAVYKGITLVSNASGVFLLAANFAEATVDVYDSGMDLVGQFADTNAPSGYAPFNIAPIAGMLFVTFAKQNPQKHDDVPGQGHGLIDIFDLATGKFHRFATGSDAGGKLREINSPWGLVLSPACFGAHSDQLLVGNFGDGTIMSFEADGKFKGLLKGPCEKPLSIDGLWALTRGNGGRGGVTNEVYFSAGPVSESQGLFGSISPAPEKKHEHGHDKDHGHGDHH
jgi:uncharacterized protein (TIGR03118 family)